MAVVRVARYQDIPDIIKLGKEAHAESRMAGVFEIDESLAKGLLFDAISAEGPPKDGATCPLVAISKSIKGVLIGYMRRAYGVSSLHVCSDAMFYVSPEMPGLGMHMLDVLHDWADGSADPVVKQHILNDMIVDPDRSERLLTRKGFRRAGYLMEKVG